MFDLTEMTALSNSASIAKRVVINHHVRSIPENVYLKSISKNDIKQNRDKYTICCQNLLLNSAIEFLNYMFDETVLDGFDIRIKTNLKQNCPNFYVSHNPGEATIIFDSLTNEQNNDFVKIANKWGYNKNIKFIPITGDLTVTKTAELFANYHIYTNPDKHIVFVTANMVSRSFSVPKIVNGIMMVNEPEYAPACQKFNRLATIDFENLNKIGNMYWFNFNNLKIKCPLYMLIYQDLINNKNKVDQNGKPAALMLDSINIFEQDGIRQKEIKCNKWAEVDLFNRINHGIVSYAVVKNYLTNHVNGILNTIKELLDAANINRLNVKNNILGSAEMYSIDAGVSKQINHNDYHGLEGTASILPAEVITVLTQYTLNHEKSGRDFETFLVDSCNILGADNVSKIGIDKLNNLWNSFFVPNIINLEWLTEI